MLDYIDLRYKPGKNDVVTEYYMEPNRISFEKACNHVAGESSIGTWTAVHTMNPSIAKKLRPSVFDINKKTKEIKIAYPKELFEAGNMPEILSSIAGNIFGMKAVNNLRLQDISFPKSIVKSFKGPRYGVKGIRKLLKVKNRPLVGTIVKPKVGLNEKQHAKTAYEAWVGGLDVVKDDENLSSMKFNKFNKRIKETLKLRDKAEKETGEKKIYMANITAETFEMLKRAEYVRSLGGEYIMLDILTCGWSGLQTVRDKITHVIHAHRAMHGALTRNPKHGISMMTIAKCSRLIGVDQLHIGTAHVGKMEGSAGEVQDIEEKMHQKKSKQNTPFHSLSQDWYGIKPVLSVASGGLHPGMIPTLIDRMGTNIVAQFGGGCHGHPDGTRAGAIAIRQAVDAKLSGISQKEYAKTHPELAKTLKIWH